MNILENILRLKQARRQLDMYNQYKIDFCCPNSGPWDCLHAVYRLRPIEKMDEEIWIALPREDRLWNYMAQHQNLGTSLELPFPSSQFYLREIYYRPAKKEIKLYVLNSLI